MNLNQLKYFLVLAKLQHYIKASEELGISQPSLSKAITKLETELNVYLFEKVGRNVVLTAEGKIFYEYVERSLNELELGKNQVLKAKKLKNQIIKIGFVSSLQNTLIPELIRNSQFQLSFHEGISLELFEKLKEGIIDVAFCSKPLDSNGYCIHRVLKQDIVVLVPDNKKWKLIDEVHLQDIINEPLLLHSEKTGMRQIVLELYNHEQLQPLISTEASEDSMLATMVSLEKGIAIVTDSEKIRMNGVKQLKLIHDYNYRYIYLVYLKHSLQPSVSYFIQEIIRNSNLSLNSQEDNQFI